MIDIKHWFFGVIEDVNDPQGSGRVRVRCTSYHSPDRAEIPTNTLPWATCMLPTTSASIAGIGVSSTGLELGSWVVGFFRDGDEKQDPFIIGTFASANTGGTYDASSDFGFGDPHNTFSGVTGYDIPQSARTIGTGFGPAFGQTNAGHYGVASSGDAGFQSSFDPPAPIIQTGASVTNLVNAALSQIGVAESGDNRGSGIQKYWSATSAGTGGYGQAWCAAFASWCVRESGILPNGPLPNTAGVSACLDWAKGPARSVTELRYNPRFVRRGDLVFLGGASSHIGIAISDSDEKGNFTSVDGNTTVSGTTGGVAKRPRNVTGLKAAISIVTGKSA